MDLGGIGSLDDLASLSNFSIIGEQTRVLVLISLLITKSLAAVSLENV